METMKDQIDIKDATDKPVIYLKVELWKDFNFFNIFCQPYDGNQEE